LLAAAPESWLRIGCECGSAAGVGRPAGTSALPGFPELVGGLLTSMRGAALTNTFERRDHRRDPNLAVWKRLARVYLEKE
jgi:hypothetical protein